ncbi:FimV family protein [Rhodoferax ferrireducens]|uniref:type IV pilus assembly protein FimV n=1 Tax=Rhodoferax ferrireducens TaxID=192843 RepID=UPI001300640F|nr:hypothetical protein [Rhodoferax ferrireducens]
MEHKASILGVALICVAFGSEALTLGRVRGAALVGQPLDMVIPVQMDAGEDASSFCFDADVFHADTRQEASRVRVVVEATAQAQTANVRVLSSAVVDEPVVTVYLRTGCGQKTTRRYVLLADLPSEVAAPVSGAQLPSRTARPPAQVVLLPDVAAAPRPSPVVANSAQPVKTKTVRGPTQAARQGIVDKRADVRAAIAAPKQTQSDEAKKPGRTTGQSRLKLDPLELLSDRVANLDAYMTFPPSEDALHNLEKIQTLEGNVKTLLALTAKNESSLADLKMRLQKAESERFPGSVIYGLIALVLVCLAALALLWTRQRRVHTGDDNWWSGADAMPAAVAPELEPGPGPSTSPATAHQELDETPEPKKARSTAVSGLVADSGPSSEPGVSLVEMSESAFDDLMQSSVVHAANRKQPAALAVVSPPAPVPGLHSEATLDVRQQAEFFVSLGQTDRAVRILAKQIDESDAPNPSLYLDLLSLLHSLSLKSDFQSLRKDFNLLFNARVPEFAVFKNEGKGLESYPDVLSRITACWSTSTILELLGAYILQNPQLAKVPVFDLAAFRDLLLLHDVAQRVVLDADLALNGQTDYSVDETLPPPMLDLDLDLGLFDSDIDGLSRPPVAAEVDIPLVMPGDHEFKAAGADARHVLDVDQMLSFDLPEAGMASGPPGIKSR